MSGWKKLASAAAAAGGGLNVEDVFSTYLWIGNGSNPRTITNGIDLSGEGGLTIIKRRDGGTQNWGWWDTERGPDSFIKSNDGSSENTTADKDLTDFNSDGFTLGPNHNLDVNSSNGKFCSWSFRKAPKFFDVVTYTGDGNNSRTVSHNLGSVPAVIWIKCISSYVSWCAVHRTHTNTSTGNFEYVRGSSTSPFGLDTTTAYDTAGAETHITSSSFIPAQVGHPNNTNVNGEEYVAYIFAHNDSDGDFGPTGDQDIIKCGSYTGNGDFHNGNEIDIGFEPQWVMVRKTGSGDWLTLDVMRGMSAYGGYYNIYDRRLFFNTNAQEDDQVRIDPMANGFRLRGSDGDHNQNGQQYIYMAIRRGPMAVPESATDVFALDAGDWTADPAFEAGFPVDLAMKRNVDQADNWVWGSRQQYTYWTRSNDNNNGNNDGNIFWDFQNGWWKAGQPPYVHSWMWRRAPNYFDIVSYVGTSGTAKAYDHNLGVVPEMIITKRIDGAGNWTVYHKDVGNTKYMVLNTNAAPVTDSTYWNNTTPTDTQFTLGANYVNNSSGYNVAYLFATLSGISKVGSYTGTGSTQTIDCGFSAGARFVMIRRSDAAGNFYVFDTQQGITTGSDQYVTWDTTAGGLTVSAIQPHNSGFTINSTSTSFNGSGATYIFYAIA